MTRLEVTDAEVTAPEVSRREGFMLAGVMGWPVAHSRSPLIHNFWLAQYGLKGAYVPLEVHPGALAAALRGLPALGFAGCNVTIPHKEAAFAAMDRASPEARRIGAVNCVVVAADGALEGFNSDGFGFIESIAQEHPSWRAEAGPITVIGAGGAARAVVASLVDAGGGEIRLVNRSPERAQALAAELGPKVRPAAWGERHAALAGAALLVNTTSQGMAGQAALELALCELPASALVVDIVYTPSETPLLAQARRRGNPVVGGLGMLLHQARPAFHAWSGVMPQVTPELRAAVEATF